VPDDRLVDDADWAVPDLDRAIPTDADGPSSTSSSTRPSNTGIRTRLRSSRTGLHAWLSRSSSPASCATADQTGTDGAPTARGIGGSDRRPIRSLLGAFAETAKLRTAGPYASLARDGYKLVLNSEFTVMTGYASLHRERTWAQLQAGVASRFPGGKTDAARWALKEPPESRPLHCDPATIKFTRRALRDYAFRAGLRDRADAEVEVALRCFIAGLCTDATAAVRADDTIEVAGGDVRLDE
jgi:hypothetical protein